MDFGHTVAPNEGGGEVMKALAEADRPRHTDQSAGQWVKSNLFNTWYNSIITVVFGTLGVLALFFLARFVLVTAAWEPVRVNTRLFLTGRFPRDETTRLVVQAFGFSGAIGLLVGWRRHLARFEADLAGLEPPTTSIREIGGVYWAVSLMILVVMGIGVDTFRPWLVLLGCVLAAAAGYAVALRPTSGPARLVTIAAAFVPFLLTGAVLSLIPDLANGSAYLIAAVATALLLVVRFVDAPAVTLSIGALFLVGAFQVLSGTGQLSWFYLTIALIPAAMYLADASESGGGSILDVVGALVFAGGVVFHVLFVSDVPYLFVDGELNQDPRWLLLIGGLGFAVFALIGAVSGESRLGRRLGLLTVIGVATWQIGRLIDLEGINWEEWGGLQLNLVMTAASITLAFPIGLMLALGRRSTLPVVRLLCTSYIELIRGVPLISLLLMAQLFVGFFLSSGNNNLSLTTKALIVITMFSSAYIAEIVRGGLQAVPKGQTEAGQAMGLSPTKIMRLLVLPQALRAVVPSMVGQFISLFKDTSLLTIIGVLEFLGVRENVHTQDAFRAVGRVETLIFAAFVFWAISFTMSRESQRLERRLDVGAR